MRIVLKSTSPRRKELLERMGYSFEIKSYDVDEAMDSSMTPYENVKRLGLLKAMAGECEGCVSIGCDTIVVLDGEIFGKPKDSDDARMMLRRLSGRYHEVMSGLGVVYKDRVYNTVGVSRVYFKELSDSDIEWYIESGECMGKAGAYAIQGLGARLIERYEGSFDSIVGLPTELLSGILKEIMG